MTRTLPNKMTAHSIVRFATAAVAFVGIGCSDSSTTIAPSAAALAARGGNPGALPDQYILPGNAVFPEGIAYDQRSGSVFVSSTTDGTIFRGDVTSETLTQFLAGNTDGRTTAIGLAVDDRRPAVRRRRRNRTRLRLRRSDRCAARETGDGASPTFINDIVIAPDGSAYATDSQSPFIYRIVSDAAGNFSLERWLNFTGTAFVSQPGFNANGIEVTPNGRYLVVIQIEYRKALPHRHRDEGGRRRSTSADRPS